MIEIPKAKKSEIIKPIGKKRAFRIFDKTIKPLFPVRYLAFLDRRKKAFPKVKTAVLFEISARDALRHSVKDSKKRALINKAVKQMAKEIRTGRDKEKIKSNAGTVKTRGEWRLNQILSGLNSTEKTIFSSLFAKNESTLSKYLRMYQKGMQK